MLYRILAIIECVGILCLRLISSTSKPQMNNESTSSSRALEIILVSCVITENKLYLTSATTLPSDRSSKSISRSVKTGDCRFYQAQLDVETSNDQREHIVFARVLDISREMRMNSPTTLASERSLTTTSARSIHKTGDHPSFFTTQLDV